MSPAKSGKHPLSTTVHSLCGSGCTSLILAQCLVLTFPGKSCDNPGWWLYHQSLGFWTHSTTLASGSFRESWIKPWVFLFYTLPVKVLLDGRVLWKDRWRTEWNIIPWSCHGGLGNSCDGPSQITFSLGFTCTPKKVKKPLVVSGCRCASAPAGVPDYWENPRKGRRKFSSLIFRAASMWRRITFDCLYHWLGKWEW